MQIIVVVLYLTVSDFISLACQFSRRSINHVDLFFHFNWCLWYIYIYLWFLWMHSQLQWSLITWLILLLWFIFVSDMNYNCRISVEMMWVWVSTVGRFYWLSMLLHNGNLIWFWFILMNYFWVISYWCIYQFPWFKDFCLFIFLYDLVCCVHFNLFCLLIIVIGITLPLRETKGRVEKYSWHSEIMLFDSQRKEFIYFHVWCLRNVMEIIL